MPWCDGCSKYWAPSSVNDDGSCPRCGADLDEPGVLTRREAGDDGGDDGGVASDEKAPWHFKLMIVSLVAYLVYRFGSIFFG